MPENDPRSDLKKSSAFSKVKSAIPFVISAALLIALLSYFKGYALLVHVQPGYVILAVFLSMISNGLLGAFKWQQVMALSNIHLSYKKVLKLWTGLLSVTFFMPFQSGHLLYAVALKKSENLGYVESFESVVYDKYLTLIGTFALMAIGQAVIDSTAIGASPWILIGASAVCLFFFFDRYALLAFSRFAFFKKRSRLIHSECPPWKKLWLLMVAIVYQSSDMVSFYLACKGLGIDMDVKTVVGVYPIILLLSYIPITFSGIGAREGLITLFMGRVLTYDQSIAAGLLVDFYEYLAPAIIGLVCLRPVLKLFGKRRGKAANLPKDPING